MALDDLTVGQVNVNESKIQDKRQAKICLLVLNQMSQIRWLNYVQLPMPGTKVCSKVYIFFRSFIPWLKNVHRMKLLIQKTLEMSGNWQHSYRVMKHFWMCSLWKAGAAWGQVWQPSEGSIVAMPAQAETRVCQNSEARDARTGPCRAIVQV